MRVVLVVYGSIDQVTGGYLYDRKIVESLLAAGDRVEILSLSRLPYLLTPLQALNKSLRSRLKEFADMDGGGGWLVIDELVHSSLFLALLLHRGPVYRMATLVHHLRSDERNGMLQSRLARLFEGVLLNRSGLILANSEITAASVRRHLKRQIPIHVCRPGRDTLPAHGDQKKSRGGGGPWARTVKLLSVGNVIPRKGHMDLIKSLIGLVDSEWQLTVVGRDEIRSRYSKRLHRLIDQGGLRDRVRFTGTVSDPELQQLYRAADIFVFSSTLEGYGIALAEALSFGLPYVAFDSGGIREIAGFTDGEIEGQDSLRCRGGFIIKRDGAAKRDGVAAFSAALGKLVETGKLRELLSEESSARSHELPTWEQTGSCFYAALHGSAARRAGFRGGDDL
jgi:glycosyltransferase involved in cell wall biosynthesis